MSDIDQSTPQTELSEHSNDAHEILRKFIVTFETLPELWNPTNSSYKNKIYRNAAYDKLLSIYTRLKPGATRVDVRRKINTLRCNYRKELKKILTSKRSGIGADEVYQPTSWVFNTLHFLGKYEQPVNSNDQGDEISIEVQDQIEELGEQFTLTAPVASRSSILPPTLPQKKRRAIGPLARQNELLQKACSFLELPREPPNNIPTITKVWGETLLTLDPQQRALAEKAVNDVLFEASQGTLHRHSVKINEDPKFGAVLQQPTPNDSHSEYSTSSSNISIISSNNDEDIVTFFTNFNS